MVVTSLTFGNPLKSSLDSCHNAKGRPTFLHREREREREREHPKLHTNTHNQVSRRALQWGHARAGTVAIAGGQTKARRFFSNRGRASTVCLWRGLSEIGILNNFIFCKHYILWMFYIIGVGGNTIIME